MFDDIVLQNMVKVKRTLKNMQKIDNNTIIFCIIISYKTYNETSIWLTWCKGVVPKNRERGQISYVNENSLITNGNKIEWLVIWCKRKWDYMDEYIEEKTTYTIDNQEYTVIARCKKDNNIEKIYEVLSRYALQKINNN